MLRSLSPTRGHNAKDMTPSIAWSRKAWKEEALDNFHERTKEDHRHEHWNRFKVNIRETSERRGGAHVGFSERIDTILSRTEL